ncbi:MAG TPA: hypothetical protein VFO16_06385 [Pseudonocardiaceae bacterium]|nr:hypothetical protein [Pseudonocardiaceae bacterium]
MTPLARWYRRARITARVALLAVITLLTGLAGELPPALALSDSPGPPLGRGTSWLAQLTPGADDSNVRYESGGLRLDSRPAGPASVRSGDPEGMLLTAAHPLTEFSSQVLATITAERPAGAGVSVDVRGTRGDGSWTEWVSAEPELPARLSAAVTAVQARVVLRAVKGGPSPVVRSLRLTALPGVRLLAARPGGAPTYRVFATREGLAGATTANGHRITPRDHFVALPSRRGLSPRDSGDYTVKVCAENGRCEWAPVWDVGPWNTTDDYWNPGPARQSWSDLPQGQPEAQAAYHDDYHDGADQFGREVRNPAGIDLADGTFWDGLGLRENSWVTVTYLWAQGESAQGESPAIVRLPVLPVRSGPGEKYPAVGLAAQHATLMVDCAVIGEPVTGGEGSIDQWLRIGPGQFIPAAHASFPGARATDDAVPAEKARTGKGHGTRQVPAAPCAAP